MEQKRGHTARREQSRLARTPASLHPVFPLPLPLLSSCAGINHWKYSVRLLLCFSCYIQRHLVMYRLSATHFGLFVLLGRLTGTTGQMQSVRRRFVGRLVLLGLSGEAKHCKACLWNTQAAVCHGPLG